MGSLFPRNAPSIDAHFLLQLNATYRARSFRVLPNLQSSYILYYTYSMWLIANCFLHFPDFVPFFFLSLSLSDCVGVFVAFLGRYSVSVTTKQTPFGSPSLSHISTLYGYTDLCTHACLQLFKMKPMHSEPLSLSSSSISRTNIEAGGRVYKRTWGKRKII